MSSDTQTGPRRNGACRSTTTILWSDADCNPKTAGPVRHTLPNGGHQQRCRRHARRPFSITVACLEPVTSFELDDLVVGVRVLAAQAAPRRLSCVIGSLRHPAPAGLVRALRGHGCGVHEDQRVSTLEGGATPASGVRGDREPPSASRSIASPAWARSPVSRDRNLVAVRDRGSVSALVVASTPPPSRPLRPTLELRRRAADTSGMHEATRARLEALLAGEEARPTALPPPRLGIVPGGTVDAARRLLRRQPSSPESSSFTRWGRGPSASADRPKRAVPGPAAQRRPRR